MRHVVNGERRSRTSKVLTGAFVPRLRIVTPFGRKGKQLERRADALGNLPCGISGHWTPSSEALSRPWNHFRECPVSPWDRWRNHRHEDRISCCNCDSCLCRGYWTGGPFCWLAAARKAGHACPIGDPVS